MSSTELVVPVTGQLLSLDAPTNELCEAFAQVRRLELELADARLVVARELTTRMDHENVRRFAAGDWQVEVDAPGRVDWDADLLFHILGEVVAEGHISADAAERVVPTYRKVAVRELGKIKAVLPPDVATRLDEASTLSGRSRRVVVKHRDEVTR